MFFVVFLICFISDNFYILSLLKKFVNNFFSFFENFFESFFKAVSQELLESTLETLVDSRFSAAVSSAAYINISYTFGGVNYFFHFFYFFVHRLMVLSGFEPKFRILQTPALPFGYNTFYNSGVRHIIRLPTLAILFCLLYTSDAADE